MKGTYNPSTSRFRSRRHFAGAILAATAATLFSVPTSTLAGVEHKKTPITWPKNLVKALQRRLLELGFDPGAIDGIFGPNTAAAIRAFQLNQGIATDGRISKSLLVRIGLEKPK